MYVNDCNCVCTLCKGRCVYVVCIVSETFVVRNLYFIVLHCLDSTVVFYTIVKCKVIVLCNSAIVFMHVCIALHCIAVHCIVWYGIVLYGTVLYCMVLYCIVLYCIALHCIVLYVCMLGLMHACILGCR